MDLRRIGSDILWAGVRSRRRGKLILNDIVIPLDSGNLVAESIAYKIIRGLRDSLVVDYHLNISSAPKL